MRPLGGVTYFFTSRAVNFCPMDKPFELETYLRVVKRSIFLYDYRMRWTWDFNAFLDKFDGFFEVLSEYSNPILSFIFFKIQTFFTFPDI